MTCSTSSSSSRRAALALLALLGALPARAGEAEAPPSPPAGPAAEPAPAPEPAGRKLADLPPELPAGGAEAPILLLPPENLTGRAADLAPVQEALAQALAAAGLQAISGEPVERFLARHRLRSTGGLPRTASAAARDELGTEAVLVTSVLELDTADPPRLSLLVRLVSAEADPVIYWMGGAARTGEDRPGLLQLGLVHDPAQLQAAVARELATSLADFLAGGRPPGPGCEGGARFRPRLAYRNVAPPGDRAASVAVLPFRNQAAHPGAGEAVALELVRQLVAAGRFQVLEPAVVREELLNRRILIPEGMSSDTARLFLGALEVDYLVNGTVLRYVDVRGPGAVPEAEFTVTMLESHTARFAWQSSSAARGRDGVFFFDLGRVRAGADLTCRLAREVVHGILGGGTWTGRLPDRPARPAFAGAKRAHGRAAPGSAGP